VSTRPEHTNPTLTAALRYARADWPVFPCVPGEKVPATRHGLLDATTDPDKITWWWSRNPGRNLAIATGSPGPDVLDVDVRKDGSGFAAFNRLRREGLIDGASAYVWTPSGGLHAYFTGTEQANGRLPGHHLDFRSHGGYIVAPPSQIGGRPYQLVMASEVLMLTVEEAARRLGLGRTLVYQLISSGELESVTVGRLRRVPAECLAEYIAALRSTRSSTAADGNSAA
jgi:excisionase family DNA binding protein